MSNKKQNFCALVITTILFGHIVDIVCVYSVHRKKTEARVDQRQQAWPAAAGERQGSLPIVPLINIS